MTHVRLVEQGLPVHAIERGLRAVSKNEYIYIHHAGHGIPHAAGKGADLVALLAEHYGKITGSGKGITGFHACEPESVMFGGRGTMHESTNMAANWKLPVVWVCENNGIGQFVPIRDAYLLGGHRRHGRGVRHAGLGGALVRSPGPCPEERIESRRRGLPAEGLPCLGADRRGIQ